MEVTEAADAVRLGRAARVSGVFTANCRCDQSSLTSAAALVCLASVFLGELGFLVPYMPLGPDF